MDLLFCRVVEVASLVLLPSHPPIKAPCLRSWGILSSSVAAPSASVSLASLLLASFFPAFLLLFSSAYHRRGIRGRKGVTPATKC